MMSVGRVLDPIELVVMLSIVIGIGIGIFSLYKVKTQKHKPVYYYYLTLFASLLATIGVSASLYHRINGL